MYISVVIVHVMALIVNDIHCHATRWIVECLAIKGIAIVIFYHHLMLFNHVPGKIHFIHWHPRMLLPHRRVWLHKQTSMHQIRCMYGHSGANMHQMIG